MARASVRELALFLVVVLGIPIVTVTIAVERFPELSPVDEFAHVDYLRRVEQGEVPRIGDRILPETARDVACRTIGGRPVADCALDEIPLEVLDAKGYSYEAQQPPLYYAVTALIRQPFRLLASGYVNSARLTGIVWQGLGLGLLWWVLRRRLGADLVPTAILCSLVALAPIVITQTAVVTNDATSVLIGASVLLVYDLVRQRTDVRTVLLGSAIVLVAVLTKPLAILPVGAVTLALLIDAGRERLAASRWALRVVPAVVAVLAYQAWQAVRDARAVTPYEDVIEALLGASEKVHHFPLEKIGEIAPRFLLSYGDIVALPLGERFVYGVATVVGLLFVLGPAISAALGPARRWVQHLQIGTLALCLIAPPLLVTQSYLEVSRDGGANTRYGMALLPLLVPALLEKLDARWVRRAATVGVVTLFVVIAISLMTYDVGSG